MFEERNRQSFSIVCQNSYGRNVIYTNADRIDSSNVIEELGKALPFHEQNRKEIIYLERYYKGDQPILYRVKKVRKDINNKTVENHAFEIVEHKTAENFGEPIQYVLRGTETEKTQYIKMLNDFNDSENKGAIDIELGRDRSICGTAYKFHWNDSSANLDMDEAPFGICRENPRDTFVVYSSKPGNYPMFSVQCRIDKDNQRYYFIYTDKMWFEIQNGRIKNSGINGIGIIPVVEYPNNERRLSDIEIVITLLDELNKIQSNRVDGIEQFVQAFMKFVNCEIDKDKFLEMCEIGAVKVKTPEGTTNGKADVEIMSSELDQQQTQTVKDDIYDNILKIDGLPDRKENSGGDTGQAVTLRNGYYFSEKRAELSEPIFKRSERQSIKIILRILDVKEILSLKLSDIDIKVTRSKMDNMQVKAQVAQMLLASGYHPKIVTKVINLFPDPEETYTESKPYLDAKWQTVDEIKAQNGGTKVGREQITI